MLKKIISVLFAAVCFTVASAAAEDTIEVRSLTFDEGTTIDEIRSANYFDRNTGAGAISAVSGGYSGQCAKFVSGAYNSSYADSSTTMNIWDSYSGTVTFEGYFKFDNFDTTYKLLHINAQAADGTAQWVSGFTVTKRTFGIITLGGTLACTQISTTKNLSKETWYHLKEIIDTNEDKVYYYLDDTLIGSGTLAYDITATKRALVSANYSDSAGTMYFDSYKVSVSAYSGSVFDKIEREPALSTRPDAAEVAEDFARGGVHPRIMATADDFSAIKKELETNSDKKKWYDWLIRQADNMLDDATLKYELRDGVRLMYVSAELEERMITLGMAYQLTGDSKYATKAYTDLAAVAAFEDWHPSHHIDVGIMAVGYAVGYDWFYSAFTSEQRKVLEEGAWQNGFADIIESYMTTESAMTDAAYVKNNHNAMCNGGAVMLALAFYDIYPDGSGYIISNAVRGFEEMLANYSDSGSWYEGTGYGATNINYLSMAFSAMEKCLGTLYGLDTKTPGLANAYSYIRNMESSAGTYNFADSDFTEQVMCSNGWIEAHFGGDTSCNLIENGATAANGEMLARAVLWNTKEQEYDAPQDKFYEDDQLLLLRDDADTFAGIKAGGTVYDHSHFDSGSFVFDSQGVRWAHDLGKDDYNLDGYWDYTGGRWKIFRLRAESHNTVIVNPDMNADYSIGSSAEITGFESNSNGAVAKIDMSDLLSERAKSASRGFCLTDSRKSLVIRDELVLNSASDVYWMMYTMADAEIDGSRVVLTDKTEPEKKIVVDFLCSSDFEIIYEDAKPLDGTPVVNGQNENEGYYRLALKTNASGEVNITVKLTPINVAGSSVSSYDKSISEWSLSDAVSAADVLSYIPQEDSVISEQVWQNITFDENADISDPYKSLYNTEKIYRAETGRQYDWPNYYGASDIVTVVEEDGNRILCMSAKEDSEYDSIDGVNASLTDRTDLATNGGFTEGIIKYSADIRFPDFNALKLLLSCKYTNDSGSDVWLYGFGVVGVGENGAVYISDSPDKYYFGVEKDKWYNFAIYVDIDNGMVSYYIDGELVYEREAPGGVAKLQRTQLRADIAAGSTSGLFVDNIIIQRVAYPEVELCCYAGENTARAVFAEGKLAAAAYSNDAASAYSNDRLEDAAVSENGSIFDYNLPENAGTLKFMLWDGWDSMVPLRKSVTTNIND